MEVVLYNSTVCRLCGEENDNGTFLYSTEENNHNISDLVNAYLPIKVSDDGQLPRTLCPGCTIQLEATVEFINLIVTGQKAIRSLYQREKEYKKNLGKSSTNENDSVIVEVDPNSLNGVYQEDHPISLQVAGLDKPKRKRGRPPKKAKSPDEQALEAAAIEQEVKIKQRDEEPTGKRRRKTPERFREVVQGKELDQIFKEEGMTDCDDSDNDLKPEKIQSPVEQVPKVPEVIGHTVSGELVVVMKGKGRGRPKGRTKQTHETCAICGKDFSNSGRYMSHIAQHGPVLYQCQQCAESFPIRLDFNKHQQETGHEGLNVLPGTKEEEVESMPANPAEDLQPTELYSTPELIEKLDMSMSLPDLNPQSESITEYLQLGLHDNDDDKKESPKTDPKDSPNDESPKKLKLKCPHCDKKYSSKQAKSMHIKAVHKGERPYICNECGVSFAYPRALSLHALSHRRRNNSKGFACDLCGKVLNHPSSVAYHKEAEHANQQYVCNKCGKNFKHKQLLQRHQLVHSQLRPYHCKVCNAKFKTKPNLINHQMLHTGVKKFSCDECKQRFAHKTSLTLHMRWHRGQKPYACKICDKAFTQKGNLSEHMRIHTGEKPFQCALCPRRFTTSSQHRLHLKRHEPKAHRLNAVQRIEAHQEGTTTVMNEDGSLIHFTINSSEITTESTATTNVTTTREVRNHHTCVVCGRVCGSRWALAKHARRHTGERPFSCPHCARTFADASNLNKHKKHVHKQSLLAVQPTFLPLHKSVLETRETLDTLTEVPQYVVETEDSQERVIYVTYDVDSQDDHYQIMEAEPTEVELESEKCELYSGDMMEEPEHMSVTDEQGNPLHFTMQDGTRLAITSLDGQSLQVITQDGQTIPVEINGFSQEEEESPLQDVSVHELDLKTDDPSSPVTQYELDLKTDDPSSPVTQYELDLKTDDPSSPVTQYELDLKTDDPSSPVTQYELDLKTDDPSSPVTQYELDLKTDDPSSPVTQYYTIV